MTPNPLAVRAALLSWRNRRAYFDGRNYRLREEPRRPVAWWNRDAKRAFPTPTELHQAATAPEEGSED